MKHISFFITLLAISLVQTNQCAHFQEYLEYRDKKTHRSHIHLYQNYHALKAIINTVRLLQKHDASHPLSFASYPQAQQVSFVHTLRYYRENCFLAGIEEPKPSDKILDVTVYILNLCHELQKPKYTGNLVYINMYKKLEDHFKKIFLLQKKDFYEA
ncbi:hypothetical protein KBD08_02285 [Candidatus Babeliales bacterium]|nr:hypothetical protein [Candidatus Babeliales bacterium]